MTLSELKTALCAIDGFSNKVVYRAWAVGEAPALPFICYRLNESNNFGADNKVYKTINSVFIELYSKYKDLASEALIEAKLDSLDIYWEKEEAYIEEEDCNLMTYSIEV